MRGGFLLLGQFAGAVVAVAARFAVEAGLFDQPVAAVVVEVSVGAVFIGETGEPAGFVPLVGERCAEGVFPDERAAVFVQSVEGACTHAVLMADQPAGPAPS